jgi:homoserine dehydrogenase
MAVRFEQFPANSPFGRLRIEWNALQILTTGGALETVTGRGAGRWPTTEAIVADLFDAHRQRPFSDASTRSGCTAPH